MGGWGEPLQNWAEVAPSAQRNDRGSDPFQIARTPLHSHHRITVHCSPSYLLVPPSPAPGGLATENQNRGLLPMLGQQM